MAANIFTGTTNSNWGTATNWSLGAVPTAADANTATFNATSPNCTVNISAVCNNIDFTGYTNTITMTNGITVSGNVTFVSTMASRVAGSGSLTINTTSAITTNGATWNNALLFSTSSTKTITGTLTVTGLFTSSTSTQTVNGGTLILNGGITMTGAMSGTTAVTLGGGTWSGTGALSNNLTLAGNSTISGGVNYGTGTLLYSSGTITVTSSTLNLIASATLNTSGMTWNNVTLNAATQTHTLTSNLNVGGTFSLLASANVVNGLFNINIGGSFNSSFAVSGTASIVLNGTGTWSGVGSIRNNLTINTAGTITISGTINYNTGTLTYTTGTVTTTGSTLTIAASTTLNTNGISWNIISCTGTTTITLSSNLTCSLLTCGNFPTINGNTIYLNSLTVNAVVSGTSNVEFNGTGTWTGTTNYISNNININCTSLTITGSTVGYRTGTLTYTTGTVTTTGSTLVIGASTTFNCAGITWNNVSFSGTSQTWTLTGNMNVSGTTSFNITTAGTLDIGTLNTGGLSMAGAGILGGSGSIVFNGTGVWGGTGAQIAVNTTINTAGTLTISPTQTVYFRNATLTYTAGTVVTTGSLIRIENVNTTLDVSGITWNNVQIGVLTLTLSSNLNVTGTLTCSGTTILNGFTANIGGLTMNQAMSGTTAIVMNGTGTWSSAGVLQNNLTINTSGTITVSGAVVYNTGTLTYITGTVLTGGSTLSTNLIAVTFNTDGIAWNNVSLGVLTTLTSNLTVNGLLTTSTVINGANIYANGGITVGNNSGGTTVIWLQGGTWSGVNMIRNNTFINGNITISGSVAFNGATLTYTSGTVVAKGSTLNINGISTTLINMHKINFDTVIITSSFTVIMNEFFSGSPNLPVKVQATLAATNYGITFQNGFEKIAKYVKVSNLTLTNTAASRGSLLILNNKGKYFTGGNNIGNIRYTNSLPNGISKGNPTVPNPMTAPIGGYISDPIFN